MPRVTFGIIVLNGEPFTRYCLRALYPFAHEIIVVEGAAPAAASMATAAGHSTDGTLDTLHRFKAEEDVENKVQMVTRDGFWSEKDEQSQAYAQRASGDYLWQVDIDEFYQPEDMRTVLQMLVADPGITAASFKQFAFWGGFDYIVDGWYLRRGADVFHRLFRWGPGYRYAKHRPPTVHDPQGRDLRLLKWIKAGHMARRGVRLYHYCLLFPHQVLNKTTYYAALDRWGRADAKREWVRSAYEQLRSPFRVHNEYRYPSWLERFHGKHPPAVEQMIADIRAGRVDVPLRPTDDIERLLASPWYALGRSMLKALSPLAAPSERLADSAKSVARRVLRIRRSTTKTEGDAGT
jgi:hypothetical protein